MKKVHGLIGLIVLISLNAALILTAPDYAVCKTIYPDEFLDLAQVCQITVSPDLVCRGNVLCFFLGSPMGIHFSRVDLRTTCLRC